MYIYASPIIKGEENKAVQWQKELRILKKDIKW